MWLVLSNRGRTPYKARETPYKAVDDARVEDGIAEEAALLKPGSQPCSWQALVVMTALISTICSIDRMCMSVAILPMSEAYSWADSTKGAVNAAFSLGYTVTNLLGGYLAAVHGPKRVLQWGVTVWSLFTLFTPPAAATGQLWVLLLVRAIMGVGEGVAFPCIQVLIKSSTPADKRTRALSLVYSGHQLGSIISLLLSPSIILRLGWPWVFILYGSLGFGWLAVWQPFVLPMSSSSSSGGGSTSSTTIVDLQQQKPKQQQQQQQQQAFPGSVRQNAEVSEDKVAAKGVGLSTWRLFAAQPACWALFFAHCMFGVAYNVAMGWLPTYYNQRFGVDVRESAWLSVLPFVCMALTTNASGWVADGLVNTGWTTTLRARKILQTTGTLVPAACLWYLAAVQGQGSESGLTALHALGLLSAMLAGLGCCGAGFAANHSDLATRLSGLLYGITNAGSSFAGSVAVYGVGVALDNTHDWGGVFSAVAWCNVLSCVVYLIYASSTPMFE